MNEVKKWYKTLELAAHCLCEEGYNAGNLLKIAEHLEKTTGTKANPAVPEIRATIDFHINDEKQKRKEERAERRKRMLMEKKEKRFLKLPCFLRDEILKASDNVYWNAVELASEQAKKGWKKYMEKTKKNDLLRAKIPAIARPDVLVITSGISNTFPENDVASIMENVKNFNDFSEDNDPWGEHDFGCFEFRNEKIYWKIDDYNGQEGLNLVLTIMLAGEY